MIMKAKGLPLIIITTMRGKKTNDNYHCSKNSCGHDNGDNVNDDVEEKEKRREEYRKKEDDDNKIMEKKQTLKLKTFFISFFITTLRHSSIYDGSIK